MFNQLLIKMMEKTVYGFGFGIGMGLAFAFVPINRTQKKDTE